MGSQTKFHTSGNGELKEVIYRIYGREIAASLVPVGEESPDGMRIEGYLGKPSMVRSNRNFEIYYINGRFIKSSLLAKAIEEGYREYLMQHKFPMCVLHISMDREQVDVNVHPTKMDVRFSDTIRFAAFLSEAVGRTLRGHEMIPGDVLEDERALRRAGREEQKEARRVAAPEPFERERRESYRVAEEAVYKSGGLKREEFLQKPEWGRVGKDEGEGKASFAPHPQPETGESAGEEFFVESAWEEQGAECGESPGPGGTAERQGDAEPKITAKKAEDTVQMDLFEERLLSVANRSRYRMIGQVFDTYLLVQFEDSLFLIDQHAAHEKVKYERLMRRLGEKEVLSQELLPPIIVSLSGQEESVLLQYRDVFAGLGFEVEEFGGSEYALRGVPVDLYGCSERELFLTVLDELAEGPARGSFQVMEERIASMSCKAAVKGNSRLGLAEAEALIDELLSLENPYNCPHGRPTIIAMTKTELERKFKRIV